MITAVSLFSGIGGIDIYNLSKPVLIRFGRIRLTDKLVSHTAIA